MKRFAAVSAVLFGVALPLLVAAPRAAGQSSSNCVEVAGLSVWATPGFNHVVYLTETCQLELECTVSTDVDPEPLKAIVPAGTTVQVVTAIASPVAVFVPRVTCQAVST